MINAFNIAPLSEIPPPLCAEGWIGVNEGLCRCYPRFRGGLTGKVPRNSTTKVTSNGTVVEVRCQTSPVSWGGDHPTSADVQLRPFVSAGNVFIHIIDGRVGRILTANFTVIDRSGGISTLIVTLEITE